VSRGMAWMLALGSGATVLLLSITAVSLTSDLRVIGLVIMGMGPITAGLVAYFEWRANLRRRMSATQHRRAA
jgi:hypothetical protein